MYEHVSKVKQSTSLEKQNKTHSVFYALTKFQSHIKKENVTYITQLVLKEKAFI